MQVCAGLEFHHRKPTGIIHRQQVQNAALAAGESRHLSVNGVAAEGGVERLDFGASLRFQPCLGILAVKGMVPVCARMARALEFLGEAHDFPGMMLAGGAPRAQAKEELASVEFGELDAAHAQTGAPVMFGNTLHTWDVGDLPPGFRDVGRGTAAGLQTRVEIAVIARSPPAAGCLRVCR